MAEPAMRGARHERRHLGPCGHARPRRARIATVAVLAASLGVARGAAAQSSAELQQQIEEIQRNTQRQIDELRRSTEQQIDALRKQLEQRDRDLAAERAQAKQREQEIRDLEKKVAQQPPAAMSPPPVVGAPPAGAPAAVAAAPPAGPPGAPPVAPATGVTSARALRDYWQDLVERHIGAEQENNPINPLGKEIQGNVYSSDNFKVRLGASVRIHSQWNSTPEGQSVSEALLPDPTIPGGGNNTDRGNFRIFAGRTRLNMAVQGPPTLGGETAGYIESDFSQNLSGGESGSVSPNPRLRHAYLRWAFPSATAPERLTLIAGQTDSFADYIPDTIDFNTMLAGLGGSNRRNPRFEAQYWRPIAGGVNGLVAVGLERPFIGSTDTVADGDLGTGDLGQWPAFSGGIGFETSDRIGEGFGVGKLEGRVRTTWAQFQQRFDSGTTNPDVNAQTGFYDRNFDNQIVHGGVTLDRIGFNKQGRAMTLKLKVGGLWTRGDGILTNSDYDRQVIVGPGGSLVPAQSYGAFVNPIFYFTDNLNLRYAWGFQRARDTDQPVAVGSLNNNFFRTRNDQQEVSLWWTPGPFTLGVAYNYTTTHFRINPATGGNERLANLNNKVEVITWFSF
jgi:hypothetical protein